VTNVKAPQAGTARGSTDEQGWADLADLVLIISREIQFRGYTDERAVSLTPSEGMVMRYLLQGHPEAPPSRIATATGLQRTNLSTVLRGLEQKGLVERHARPGDGRGVTVHLTDRGRSNYALVRHEWAAAVSAAAGGDTTNLDAALTLLTAVKDGLARTRPQTPASYPAT
jgi:DNA-binding MarR family transcriptional regulator